MSDGEQAQRLRQFAESVGGPSKLAEKLGISPQSMSNYLAGRNVAGPKMRTKLEALGCDIVWLTTGKTVQEVNEQFPKTVETNFRIWNPGKAKLLDVIEKYGIESAEQLDLILAARKMILAEPHTRNKSKGRKK